MVSMRKSTHLRKFGSEKSPSFTSWRASRPVCFLKAGDGVIVEAGPTVFPAIEVGHPVGNVDVDAVDAGGGDLAHALHVDLAPLGSRRG